MKCRKGPLHYPTLTMCIGKLWCGLCNITCPVSPSRGWLERLCLLLAFSLYRNLIGSGVCSYAVLGNCLVRNSNIGKCWRCEQNQFRYIMCWLFEMGEVFRAVACRRCTWGCQRGLCHGGWTVETRCEYLWKLQRLWPRERRWWILGKLFMKLFYFFNIKLCSWMFPHACSFWNLFYILIFSPSFFMCVCYITFLIFLTSKYISSTFPWFTFQMCKFATE